MSRLVAFFQFIFNDHISFDFKGKVIYPETDCFLSVSNSLKIFVNSYFHYLCDLKQKEDILKQIDSEAIKN